ncbi:MAG: ribosome-binding factor A [Lentisphaerae bacterium]|nr:ribosome-binding factor A [Lentisphaerota bacterium]
MSVSRLTRLNALLQRELGALMKFHISPELKNTLVTITGVKVTSNLREASVYYSVFSQDANAEEKVASLLQAKRVQLQSDLAARVVMKYTPVLHFRYDSTPARADRVMAILNELQLSDEEHHHAGPAAEH